MKIARIFVVLTVAIVASGLEIAPRCVAGEIDYLFLDPNVWGDVDTGLDPAKRYTHLLDFGTSGPATVNGVVFTPVRAEDIVAGAVSGFDYAVTSGLISNHGGAGEAGVDNLLGVYDVLWDFIYNGDNDDGGVAVITLSGLLPEREYDTRIFVRGFADAPGRTASIAFDTGGLAGPEDSIDMIDQNQSSLPPVGFFPDNSAYMLSYRFTAESDTLTISITQDTFNNSWHLYGLTNEALGITHFVWNGSGPGNWDSNQWIGGSFGEIPAADSAVTVLADEVTVTGQADAQWLSVESGGIAIGAGGALRVLSDVNFAPEATLSLGNDSTFSAGSGRIPSFTTTGDATIGVTRETLTAEGYDDGGGSQRVLTKTGQGTLAIDNFGGTAISAASTTIRVAEGTLDVTGGDPLGGAPGITLAGGTFTVRDGVKLLADISTGFDNDTGLVIDGWLFDFDYTITPGDLLATVLPEAFPIPPWAANNDQSKWIGFGVDSSNADPGDYDFTTTVSLDDIDPATVVLSGSWSTDNAGLDVLINGTSTGASTTGNFGVMHSLGTLGAGLFQAGENTIAFRLNNAGDLPNPAGMRVEGGLYSLEAFDLSTKTITVDGGGTFDPQSVAAVNVGSLTMKDGVLIIAGTAPQVDFLQTNIDSQAEQVGFDPQVATNLGPIDGGSAGVIISKVGQGDLTLDDPGTNLADATFSIQGGRLIGVHGQDPFGQAALELAGGELVLAGGASDGPAAFDHAASVTADSILTAGPAGTGTADVDVVLGSGGNALTLGEGSTLLLNVEEADGYSLEIAAPLSGAGGISILRGAVTFSGGGQLGSLEVTGGTVGTGAGQLTVTESFTLNESPFSVEGGASIGVSGDDLLTQTNLTLQGGTVRLGVPVGTLVKDVSTGFDDQLGRVLEAGEVDTDYFYTPGDASPVVLPEEWPIAPGVWLANSETSKWIGFPTATSSTAEGDYDFSIPIVLDGFDPQTATLAGQWATDNGGLDILINGVSTGNTNTGFVALSDFEIPAGLGLFYPGLNVITFRFNNAPPGDSPAGLRVDALLHADAIIGGGDQEHVNLTVTTSTDFVAPGPGLASFGDLSLEAGADLSLQGAAEVSFRNVDAAAGTSILGADLAVRETLTVTEGPGTLSLQGGLIFTSGSQWLLGVGTDAADQITAQDNVVIEDDSTLAFRIDGADPFTAGTYVLIDSEGEDGIIGTFAAAEGLGSYVTDGGLTYNEGELSLLIEKNLHPGDADLSTATDLSDFNIWNANKFTSGTDWAAGDFNSDGQTDLSDFNIWNANKFTVATGGAAAAPTQVPEPGTLLLLAFAAAGLLVVRRRVA